MHKGGSSGRFNCKSVSTEKKSENRKHPRVSSPHSHEMRQTSGFSRQKVCNISIIIKLDVQPGFSVQWSSLCKPNRSKLQFMGKMIRYMF